MSSITIPVVSIRAPKLDHRDRVRLALEILAAYRTVHRLQGNRLPELVAQLRDAQAPRAGLPLPDPAGDGVRLGHAVTRTLRLVPARTMCLVRALVLLRLLASRGVEGELVISALPGERSTLDAHAWVELDGRPLLPPGPDRARLLVL